MKSKFHNSFYWIPLICATSISLTATALPLQLVSTPSISITNAGGSADSMNSIVSADGRYILFSSRANNLTTNTPSADPFAQNVYLRDRLNQSTILISVSLNGTAGNGESIPIEISTNGQYVLFEGTASDLVANDTNHSSDVFIRNLLTSTTTLISVNTNGLAANNASHSSAMTPNARYVAFSSSGSDLIANDTNSIPDIFVRDLQLNTTTLVTPGAKSSQAVYPPASELADITPDGRYVAFYSSATNLASGVTNAGEIYVRDLVAGHTIFASTNAHQLMQSIAGTTNAISFNPAISEDGSILVYEASPLTTAGKSFGVIMRHHINTGVTEVINTNATRIPYTEEAFQRTLEISSDGRFIAYTTKNTLFPGTTNSAVYVWDAQLSTNLLASGNQAKNVSSSAYWPAITPSGQFVLFIGSGLTSDSLDPYYHIYRRDLQSSTTTCIDVSQSGLGTVVFGTLPRISDDGRSVAFDTPFSHVLPDDNNGSYDVFVRDTLLQNTELVSVRLPSLPALSANGSSGFSSYSANTNGRYVAFYSEAENLVPNDTNHFRDLFLRDRFTGSNVLVSVAVDGSGANGLSAEPSISADGRYVAFSSTATNLVSGDTNKFSDVFIRDLTTGSTTLVSKGTNNLPSGNGDSFTPIVSADGQSVLFHSTAKNLAAGSYSASSDNLFFRDLPAGKTYPLTTSGVTRYAMTPDGLFVAFASGSTVSVWSSQGHTNIYSTSGVTALGIAISSDGHRMAFCTATSTYWVDLVAKTNKLIGSASTASFPRLQFSSDGNYLVYSAPASGKSQIYLYDFVNTTNVLITRNFSSALPANGNSDSPTISSNGRFVAYRSFATDIVLGDANGSSDLFLYDRFGGSTTLITLSQAGNLSANNRSLNPVFVPDGQTLLFQSLASDLVPQDYNLSGDIFALNLGVSALVDSDGDGMDDAWEIQHFGTLARDGTADFDGDGVTDLFEFQTGTDPGDPNSFFHGQLVFGGSPTLLWTVAPGKAYQVQYKDSLSDSDWKNFTGPVTITGSQAFATDTANPTGQRFYRIVLSQ